MRRLVVFLGVLVCAILAVTACGDDSGGATDGGVDGTDGGPSTAHCRYEALPANSGAGGAVEEGDVSAGTAEIPIGLPVTSALGGYSARAGFLGNAGRVDLRAHEFSGTFNPSIGIATVPRIKALALTAGDETIVILKGDLIFPDDSLTHDVADRLGLPGKVVFTASHSHSAPGQFSDNTMVGGMGSGITREKNRTIMLENLVAAGEMALASRRPARIGVAVDPDFDPMNDVAHDRRGENDQFWGGMPKKDDLLFVLRVDGTDGSPIAVAAVFGMHGVILDADNALFSTDAPGSVERAMEEDFDEQVLVMHIQGTGGDVSPTYHGGVSIIDGDVAQYNFASAEAVGRYALPMIRAAWTTAGGTLKDRIALSMVTRSIELGPDYRTFTVRDGALQYSPFDGVTPCDGQIWSGDQIISPIDEFNAPYGAGLCEGAMEALFPAAQLPGTEGVFPYNSCTAINVAGPILNDIFELAFEPEGLVCASTRTTISAIRLDDWLIGTLPGEPVSTLSRRVRDASPVAPEKTIIFGYSQGEIGYLLAAEDWLQGGYEPSINFWGPLEGEMIGEHLAALFPLAMGATRQDAASDGATRLSTPVLDDSAVPPPDPAPMAGVVPSSIPAQVYTRGRVMMAQAQPAAQVPRLGVTRFVWIGEDPLSGTPIVTLQREISPGTFADVTRRSGRKVTDGDLLLFWTPQPLVRDPSIPRVHYWVVEWQAVSTAPAAVPMQGLALGTYRFHVQGTGYAVDSSPFQVVPATLRVTAGANDVTVALDGTGGYRLLDDFAPSDGPVPLRGATVSVRVDGGGARSVTLDAAGHATLGDTVTSEVQVTDAFGNRGADAP